MTLACQSGLDEVENFPFANVDVAIGHGNAHGRFAHQASRYSAGKPVQFIKR
jgi:hypothetical protein